MSTHTVALNDEAYRRLRDSREKGESFSKVIVRLTRPRKHLADFSKAWGDLSPEDYAELEEARQHRRELGRNRTRRLLSEGGT